MPWVFWYSDFGHLSRWWQCSRALFYFKISKEQIQRHHPRCVTYGLIPNKKNHTNTSTLCWSRKQPWTITIYTWGCSAAAVSILVWLLVHDSPTSAHSGQVKALKTPKVESKEPELSGFGFGTWGWLRFFFGGCDCVMVTWNGRHVNVFYLGKRINWQIGYGEIKIVCQVGDLMVGRAVAEWPRNLLKTNWKTWKLGMIQKQKLTAITPSFMILKNELRAPFLVGCFFVVKRIPPEMMFFFFFLRSVVPYLWSAFKVGWRCFGRVVCCNRAWPV